MPEINLSVWTVAYKEVRELLSALSIAHCELTLTDTRFSLILNESKRESTLFIFILSEKMFRFRVNSLQV